MKSLKEGILSPIGIKIILLIVVSLFITGCKKKPTVTTMDVTDIQVTTATCGGNVTSDGRSVVTSRGVCWSTSENPDITGNKTTDGTGTGKFTSAVTGLLTDKTYYIRAYATNNVGTAYGKEISFKTPFANCGTVTDADGNIYNTVTIGTQCWMKENLKTTKYNNGTSIPFVEDKIEWTDLRGPGYCWYNNDEAGNKATYGALYTWYTITNNLCPTGWHVPADAEWTTLTNVFLDGEGLAGGQLKEAGNIHWKDYNSDATNESGFTALPGGFRSGSSSRDTTGGFHSISTNGFWWASTERRYDTGKFRSLESQTPIVRGAGGDSDLYKYYGLSVRCVKD